MDQEGIVLNEMIQTEKDRQAIDSTSMWNLKNKASEQTKQIDL